MSNTKELGDDVTGELESSAGVDSYSAGGTAVATNLGTVDVVDASIDNGAYAITAYPDPNNPTQFIFELHNVSDGTEVADATDISTDTISYEAYSN